jgi:peptidylprolyl isomerase
MGRRAVVVLVALVAACKSNPAPPVTTPDPPPRVVPLDTKVAWMIRLEHQRTLRDAGRGAVVEPGARLDSAPDLTVLARDANPAVRRRALLSIGRVGDPGGVATLATALSDADPDVRSSAAFSLGILGAAAGAAPLLDALKDPSARVRGRAAEGLGLLGHADAAAAIAAAFPDCAAPLAAVAPDDESEAVSPEADACRLALSALAGLRNYDALARLALDASGAPVSRWWPVASALQRLGDTRAVPALVALASTPGVHTASFALRGLAALREPRAIDPALSVLRRGEADVRLRVTAARVLGDLRAAQAVAPLLEILEDRATPRLLALEAVVALGAIGDRRALDAMLDRLTDRSPAMRAAAFAAAARLDPEGFLLVFSGFEPDREWSVRAALATVLGTLPPDRVRGALQDLAADQDGRVQGPALEALARVGAPDLTARLFAALEAPDFAVRATAARLVGAARPAGGAERLEKAYARGESDATHVARASALAALARYGLAVARPVLTQALRDRDWPVRLQAAALLRSLGDGAAEPARPATVRHAVEFFESDALLHPPFAPHAFLETSVGTIEIELDMSDTPLASLTFMELSRAGFFNGLRVQKLAPALGVQAGDPRGDGFGGPGYAIRDELGPRPFVRGTVGLATDGRDTGGSQFFITVMPQPQLDGRHTAFGRVVQGQDVLDALAPGDVIERVRIWDGVRGEDAGKKERGR